MPPERFGARSRRLLVWLYIAASSSLPLLPWRPPFDDAYPPVPEAPLDGRRFSVLSFFVLGGLGALVLLHLG